MNREQIIILLDFLRNHGGKYEVGYMKQDSIETPEDCYSIYYSGSGKLGVSYYKDKGVFFVSGPEEMQRLTESYAISAIEEIMKDNISKEFHQAMTNLGWGDYYEVLKYFEDNSESHQKLKDEINRLLSEKNEQI